MSVLQNKQSATPAYSETHHAVSFVELPFMGFPDVPANHKDRW